MVTGEDEMELIRQAQYPEEYSKKVREKRIETIISLLGQVKSYAEEHKQKIVDDLEFYNVFVEFLKKEIERLDRVATDPDRTITWKT
jgi:hypothetical protein